jgi:hypothetical protein
MKRSNTASEIGATVTASGCNWRPERVRSPYTSHIAAENSLWAIPGEGYLVFSSEATV